MKIISLLAGILVLSGGSLLGVDAVVDQIPGSGAMPPKTILTPLPPAPAAHPEEQDRPMGVTLGVWIREDGTVESAEVLRGAKVWREAALAAIRQWRFEPVQWEGKAIMARTEVSFTRVGPKDVRYSVSPLPNFPVETHTPEEFGLIKPQILFEPEAILPLMVRGDRRRLEATVRYVVNEEGKTERFDVLEASSEAAIRSALDGLAESRYQGGSIRGLPVVVEQTQGIVFAPIGDAIPALFGAADMVDPLYPYERLQAETEGEAAVRFTLNSKGGVASTELIEASHEDFGGALIGAIESWRFSPEAAAAQPVREYRHAFRVNDASYAGRRLVKEIKEGKQISRSAAGLDEKPTLLGRPALGYPRAFLASGATGSADVEFIIDRTGLAQLPRVLKASDPAFGWAAATCVNGMRFKPLTRGGKPVEVRVVFPFKFTPPKAEEKAAAQG